jgi:carbamoylphosphate synthase large subunit
MNLVGDSMPTLLSNDNQDTSKRIAVLKEPMGKSGAGVFFVHDAQEIHEIIESNRKKAVEEPGFLDELIAQKGRIPSWGKFAIFVSIFDIHRFF